MSSCWNCLLPCINCLLLCKWSSVHPWLLDLPLAFDKAAGASLRMYDACITSGSKVTYPTTPSRVYYTLWNMEWNIGYQTSVMSFTLADHSSIFSMNTVVILQATVTAVSQLGFISSASYHVQEYHTLSSSKLGNRSCEKIC